MQKLLKNSTESMHISLEAHVYSFICIPVAWAGIILFLLQLGSRWEKKKRKTQSIDWKIKENFLLEGLPWSCDSFVFVYVCAMAYIYIGERWVRIALVLSNYDQCAWENTLEYSWKMQMLVFFCVCAIFLNFHFYHKYMFRRTGISCIFLW